MSSFTYTRRISTVHSFNDALFPSLPLTNSLYRSCIVPSRSKCWSDVNLVLLSCAWSMTLDLWRCKKDEPVSSQACTNSAEQHLEIVSQNLIWFYPECCRVHFWCHSSAHKHQTPGFAQSYHWWEGIWGWLMYLLTWVSLFLSDAQIVATTLTPSSLSCASNFFALLSSWITLAFERFLNWFKPWFVPAGFEGPTPSRLSDALCWWPYADSRIVWASSLWVSVAQEPPRSSESTGLLLMSSLAAPGNFRMLNGTSFPCSENRFVQSWFLSRWWHTVVSNAAVTYQGFEVCWNISAGTTLRLVLSQNPFFFRHWKKLQEMTYIYYCVFRCRHPRFTSSALCTHIYVLVKSRKIIFTLLAVRHCSLLDVVWLGQAEEVVRSSKFAHVGIGINT